jgi:hypothetical protein
VNIIKPKWRSVREVPNLAEAGIETGFDDSTGGAIFEAEKGTCYAYLAEIDGKVKYVVPIERDEYAYDTAEEASRCHQLIEFAVLEGMFPTFRQSIANTLQDFIEQQLAVELMSDRDAGDIAPEQDAIERQAIDEIASPRSLKPCGRRIERGNERRLLARSCFPETAPRNETARRRTLSAHR